MPQTPEATSDLARQVRDLNLLRELSLILQSSVDPAELQEAILRGLVDEMGYPQATIALYDEKLKGLTGWLSLGEESGRLAHTDVVLLTQDRGPLVRALQGDGLIEVLDGEPPVAAPYINHQLAVGAHYVLLPMHLRGQLVGVILLSGLPPAEPLTAAERQSLEYLTTHAGVALGSVRLCIERAQRTAVAEERNRIAAELHDNVSQALYGLAYGLDAGSQLLSADSAVRPILSRLRATVTETQQQVRAAIFDIEAIEISADTFAAGLHRHLRAVSPIETIALRIDLPGDFDRWAAGLRRHLRQIAQEGVTNAAKHANAGQIIVRLGRIKSRNEDQIELRIADDGEGFDPLAVDETRHFGLKSIRERVSALGGELELNSDWGEGTLIIVRVPHSPAADNEARP